MDSSSALKKFNFYTKWINLFSIPLNRVTTSGTTSDSEQQWMAASDS